MQKQIHISCYLVNSECEEEDVELMIVTNSEDTIVEQIFV